MQERSVFHGDEAELNYSVWHPDPTTAPASTLLLLHGITMSWMGWLGVAEKLGDGRRRVFALDSRGHGRSSRVEGGYRLIDYPRDHQAFLRNLVGEPAVLIGHSLGALNSIFIAAETPELVRAVVLEDPPLYAYEDGLGGLEAPFKLFHELAGSGLDIAVIAERIREATIGVPDEFADGFAQFVDWLDPATLGQVLDSSAFESWNIDALLERIQCPVLLLVGNPELGGALPVAGAERAAAHLANCHTVFLNDVGHLPHLEAPDQFINAVTPFLEMWEGRT